MKVTIEHLRSFKELGQPAYHWDLISVVRLSEQMDPESHKKLQIAHRTSNLISTSTSSQHKKSSTTMEYLKVSFPNSEQSEFTRGSITVHAAPLSCIDGCNEEHQLHECLKFKTRTIPERFNGVKAKRGCYNCLQLGHNASKCTSKVTCGEGKQKPHTLLHRPSQNYICRG